MALKLRAVRMLLGSMLALAAAGAGAQPFVDRSIEINGELLHFSMRAFPAGASLAASSPQAGTTGALYTATLLNQHLLAGRIEEAALLSNAPRRKFEVLRDYRLAVGEDDFRKIYSQYFQPENHLVAEVVMAGHSLLVWHLKSSDRLAGQYYVEVEGKVLIDDTPSVMRKRLSRVLEAIRAGKLPVSPG